MSVLPICGDKLGLIVPGFFLPYSSETFPPSFAKRHKDAEPLGPIIKNVHVRFARLIILGINITVEQLAVADGIPGSKKLCRMLSPRLQKKTRKFIFSYQVAVVIQGDVFSTPTSFLCSILSRSVAVVHCFVYTFCRRPSPGSYSTVQRQYSCRLHFLRHVRASAGPGQSAAPAAAVCHNAADHPRPQPFVLGAGSRFAQGAPGALCTTGSNISPFCRDSPSFARDFA